MSASPETGSKRRDRRSGVLVGDLGSCSGSHLPNRVSIVTEKSEVTLRLESPLRQAACRALPDGRSANRGRAAGGTLRRKAVVSDH
jgi:hypothetical protein